jgi:hypothetical protein
LLFCLEKKNRNQKGKIETVIIFFLVPYIIYTPCVRWQSKGNYIFRIQLVGKCYKVAALFFIVATLYIPIRNRVRAVDLITFCCCIIQLLFDFLWQLRGFR